MATLGAAIALCAQDFKDVTDKSGRPYFEHCWYVMEGAQDDIDEVKIAFLLHDWLEDIYEGRIEEGKQKLLGTGFTHFTVNIISSMTHLPEDDYDTYIRKLSTNKYARKGKLRDLRHNMDATRLKGLRKKDFERLEKYARAYTYLAGIIDD